MTIILISNTGERQMMFQRPIVSAIRLTDPEKVPPCIFCTLRLAPRSDQLFPDNQSVFLVVDRSRPTVVGWSWTPMSVSDHENSYIYGSSSSEFRSDSLEATFLYRCCDSSEIRAFFPIGSRVYEPQVDIDSETGTVWFPLPKGNSVHSLMYTLDCPALSLESLVEDWFAKREVLSPLSFSVEDVVGWYNAKESYYSCSSKTTEKIGWIAIPHELLRDPIRNGSDDPASGFNPWNEHQRAAISAHLEGELVRLQELFQQDASSHTTEVVAGDP
jgi:hypothetical protein